MDEVKGIVGLVIIVGLIVCNIRIIARAIKR
jgi:hypothetical protein